MNKKRLSEATTAGGVGKFKVPIVLAPEQWVENQLAPFTNPVYQYTNAELAYEEASGEFEESPEKRARIEKETKKISALDTYLKKFYTGQNDEEGSNIGDIESPSKIIKNAVGPLKEGESVWNGTKKKINEQLSLPLVDICRKEKNGSHPKCSDSDSICKSLRESSRMTISEKKEACQRKKIVETPSLKELIKKVLNEQYNTERIYLKDDILRQLKSAPNEIKRIGKTLQGFPCENDKGDRNICVKIPEVIHVYLTGRY